jgi:putative hydrolase of the HAD superfamily
MSGAHHRHAWTPSRLNEQESEPLPLKHTTPPAVSTVIFDYGEVLSQPLSTRSAARMEELAGVPAARFWEAYWGLRPEFDRGLPAARYWQEVGDRLGADWSPGLHQELWSADVAGWLDFQPHSVDLLRRIGASGARLALLSNAPREIGGALRHSPALDGFHAVFFSGDIGLVKPDPEIYKHVLSELGVEPEGTLFVDDREENVRSAGELGIRVHHYRAPEALTAQLRELGLLAS